MWSAKVGAVDNTGAYDRLDHVVPLPGLFHAQMHVVEAIISRPTGVMKLKEASRLITGITILCWKVARRLLARETWSSPRTYVH